MPSSEQQWSAASILNVLSLGIFWARFLFPVLPQPVAGSPAIYEEFYYTLSQLYYMVNSNPDILPHTVQAVQLVPEDAVVRPAPLPNPRPPRDVDPTVAPEDQDVPGPVQPAPQPPPLPSRPRARKSLKPAKAPRK